MSAVLGLIDTAPNDQLDVPLNVSEIGTLGAPVLDVPVARTSGFVVPPLLAFHCDTWGPGMVTVRFPPMASVSRIMPLITLGTSSWEFVAVAPSTEMNVPMGTVWSTPLNVVTPATTPICTAEGIFTV